MPVLSSLPFKVHDFSMLRMDEVANISHFLVFSHEGVAQYTNGELMLVSGIVSLATNLRHGDSGSPIFAILENGVTAICGAISHGTHS